MQAARTDAVNSVRDVDSIEQRCYYLCSEKQDCSVKLPAVYYPLGALCGAWDVTGPLSEGNPACIPFTDIHSNGRSDVRPRWQRFPLD